MQEEEIGRLGIGEMQALPTSGTGSQAQADFTAEHSSRPVVRRPLWG